MVFSSSPSTSRPGSTGYDGGAAVASEAENEKMRVLQDNLTGMQVSESAGVKAS